MTYLKICFMRYTVFTIVIILVATITRIGLTFIYPILPSIEFFPGLVLLPWIILEIYLAILVRKKISSGNIGFGRGKLEPILVFRMVLIAKASLYVAIIIAGFWLGFIWLLVNRIEILAAKKDLTAVVFCFLVAILLIGVALWLEKSCRVPPRSDINKKFIDANSQNDFNIS